MAPKLFGSHRLFWRGWTTLLKNWQGRQEMTRGKKKISSKFKLKIFFFNDVYAINAGNGRICHLEKMKREDWKRLLSYWNSSRLGQEGDCYTISLLFLGVYIYLVILVLWVLAYLPMLSLCTWFGFLPKLSCFYHGSFPFLEHGSSTHFR